MNHQAPTVRRYVLKAGIDAPLGRFLELTPVELEATMVWALCKIRIEEGCNLFRAQAMPRWLEAFMEGPRSFAGIRLSRVPSDAPPPPVPDGELEPFVLPVVSPRGASAHRRYEL